jgi:hypothetical protein
MRSIIRFLVRHCPPWRWLRAMNCKLHNPEPPRVARSLMTACGTWDTVTGQRVDAYRCGARVVVVRDAAQAAP